MRLDISRNYWCDVKKFELNPRLLDCCCVIPFANRLSELDCPAKNHIRNINGLVLCIRRSGDVGKLEKFFDDGEYGHDCVSRMVCFILDDVFALGEIVWHQQTVVVLEVSQNVRHGVVD